jgi:hypothetical protein
MQECLVTNQIIAAFSDLCGCFSRVPLELSLDFYQSINAKHLAIFVEQSWLKDIILTLQ